MVISPDRSVKPETPHSLSTTRAIALSMVLMVLLQSFSVLWETLPFSTDEHAAGLATLSESTDRHHWHADYDIVSDHPSYTESHQCDNCCHCHGSHLSLVSQSMVPGTVTFPPLHNVISIGQPARFPDLIDRPPIA